MRIMGILRMVREKLDDLKALDDYLPFALIAICVVSARFIESELMVILIYMGALAIYVWRKYDARMFVCAAMFLLLACGVLLAVGYEVYANIVAVWAYYFLVIGVIGLLIAHLREKKNDKGDDKNRVNEDLTI